MAFSLSCGQIQTRSERGDERRPVIGHDDGETPGPVMNDTAVLIAFSARWVDILTDARRAIYIRVAALGIGDYNLADRGDNPTIHYINPAPASAHRERRASCGLPFAGASSGIQRPRRRWGNSRCGRGE